VNSSVLGGELVLDWSYSSKHYNRETIIKLAKDYIDQLQRLIAHCLEQGGSGSVHTPGDYGLSAEITYQELDSFLDDDNNDSIISF
jgi:non-ribosomal peptide synthase protein (TIGR01720 family)